MYIEVKSSDSKFELRSYEVGSTCKKRTTSPIFDFRGLRRRGARYLVLLLKSQLVIEYEETS